MSSPLYKKALIIGATSGIGEALAAKLVSQGSKVVVVGRRQKRLDEFVLKHGKDNASAIAFDITKLDEIPGFAAEIAKHHPDVDCVVLNSGIQRPFNFAKPETVDLSVLDLETTTNYTSYVHLTVALLPLLQKQQSATHLIYISATLGLVPGMLRTGNYNAVKGALHNFCLVLREQLKKNGDSVKVVEVFPPAVQTELHDERHQPDLKGAASGLGMPLQDFTDTLYTSLAEDKQEIAIGHGADILTGFEADRQKRFHAMIEMVEGLMKQYLK